MQQRQANVQQAWSSVALQPSATKLKEKREELQRMTALARLDRPLNGNRGMRAERIREQFAPPLAICVGATYVE